MDSRRAGYYVGGRAPSRWGDYDGRRIGYLLNEVAEVFQSSHPIVRARNREFTDKLCQLWGFTAESFEINLMAHSRWYMQHAYLLSDFWGDDEDLVHAGIVIGPAIWDSIPLASHQLDERLCEIYNKNQAAEWSDRDRETWAIVNRARYLSRATLYRIPDRLYGTKLPDISALPSDSDRILVETLVDYFAGVDLVGDDATECLERAVREEMPGIYNKIFTF